MVALCFQLHQGGFLHFEINTLNITQQDKNKALVALYFQLHQGGFFALLQNKSIDFKTTKRKQQKQNCVGVMLSTASRYFLCCSKIKILNIKQQDKKNKNKTLVALCFQLHQDNFPLLQKKLSFSQMKICNIICAATKS